MIKSYHYDTKGFTEEKQGFQNVLKKASASAKAGHSKQLSKGQKIIIFTWITSDILSKSWQNSSSCQLVLKPLLSSVQFVFI